MTVHAVSLGNPGEDDHNTLVFEVDVVVPIEMDLDGDPLQDDEVRLRSFDGSFERVVSCNDPDVEDDEDARLMFYRFRAISRGAYTVSVRIGGRWTVIIRDLIVGASGVTVGGVALARSAPTERMAHPDDFETQLIEPEPGSDDPGCDCSPRWWTEVADE